MLSSSLPQLSLSLAQLSPSLSLSYIQHLEQLVSCYQTCDIKQEDKLRLDGLFLEHHKTL